MIIIWPVLVARTKICEMHSRFRPEDLKGRKHLGKKCFDKRIKQKWILKKYRSGYTPDLCRSSNGPTMGGSARSKDLRVAMKEGYCSSANPVASKGLCWKSLCSEWCSAAFVFKIPKFPDARWNIARSSVFLSQTTGKLMGRGLKIGHYYFIRHFVSFVSHMSSHYSTWKLT